LEERKQNKAFYGEKARGDLKSDETFFRLTLKVETGRHCIAMSKRASGTGLPDGIFSYPKSQFRFNFESL
jgi:hypothetical protein